MQDKRIRKTYDSLQPEELYRLLVSAAARRDDAERDEIASRCPRVAASVRHPAFELAFEGTRAVLDAAVPLFARYLGWLEAIDLVIPSIATAVEFLLADRVPEDPQTRSPSEPDEEPPFLALWAGQVLAKRLLGAANDALAEVFAEHGLDADEVLRAFAPGLAETLRELIEATGEAGKHPAWATEQFRSLFAKAWTDATG